MQPIDQTPQPAGGIANPVLSFMELMSADASVTISVTLPDEEALALAQSMRRPGWVDWRQSAVDDVEAREMRAACECVSRGLAEVGFAARWS